MTANSSFSSQEIETFQAFDATDFDSDVSFQEGLKSLGISQEQTGEIDKAKMFYFSRQHSMAFDPDRYKAWKKGHSEPEPEYPKSFQEIMEMVEKGIPIPGIKIIPDRIHNQPPSQPSMPPRRKPWFK